VALIPDKPWMLNVHHYLSIRTAHSQGESVRKIARRLRHSQDTVRKVIASQSGAPTPRSRTRPLNYPKLGNFVAIIDRILQEDESAPLKQRHTSMQIHRRLVKEHAYTGKYDQVRRYVNKHQRGRRETLIPLDHAPGERMECDFGQVSVAFPDGLRKVDVLIVVWSWSHAPFMLGVPNQRTESVLHGMTAAMDFFGAVARQVWWDNPRTIAKAILKGRQRVLNDDYAALASHYRFEPRACMPGKGQEKSDVERTVYALQRRACTPVPQALDLADFNRQLLAFCLAERQRTVAGQCQSIGQRLEIEKLAAIPLPQRRFDPCIGTAVMIDKYQTAMFEHSRYSVPKWAAFLPATIKAYVDRIEILQGHQLIARHTRCRERGRWIVEPLHYVAALSARPHALDHSNVFKDWKLPAIFGELRHRFESEHGENAGIRQYIRVLQLLTRHSAARVGEAIGRLWHRVHLRSEDVQEKLSHLEQINDPSQSGGDPDATAPMEKKEGSSARDPGAAASSDAVDAAQGARHSVLSCVHVPPPDLRRFNLLLSSYQQGDPDHAFKDNSAAVAAAAAQPQGPEAADDAGGA
jgi:transposase